MKNIYSVLVLFTVLGCTQSQEITFELYAPNVPENETVFIAGGHSELGNWDPGAIPMLDNGNGIWMISIAGSSGEIEYKYTLGSWEREAGISEIVPAGNRITKAGILHHRHSPMATDCRTGRSGNGVTFIRRRNISQVRITDRIIDKRRQK